ncbi:MAG: hypothetical protein RSF82_02350 [Angelakisella sp.]
MGHSKNMDTYGVYSHEMTDDKRRTANNLNEILDKVLHIKSD